MVHSRRNMVVKMKEKDIEQTKKVYKHLKEEAERIAKETGEIVYSIDVETGIITFIEPEEDILTKNGLFIKKKEKKK